MPLAIAGLAASPYVPWEDLTQADFVYSLATRFASVDGRQVHYPTPTAELSEALAARPEPLAQRHLAEARLALGDRAGAVAAITRWAESEGPEAWAEAARWCAAHHAWPAAFEAAQSALPGLRAEAQRALADDVVRWADAHPDAADRLLARARRAELFPRDVEVLEDWIRALEQAGKLGEAQAALEQSTALPATTRLLIRSDLLVDHDQQRAAFELLDAALGDGSGALFDAATQRAYAARVDKGAPQSPETWRATLERAWDARALVRLATYFQGQRRGDAAADLLRQVERRHESSLDRPGLLLVSRLWSDIDAVPEAFRARLAAAQAASGDEQLGDLVELARLALRAGGRALPWGAYNDEPYRWVARLDRTPGFWTGGLSFLLTGQDWSDALANLESESLPERTFRTARLLVDELARRAPAAAELPSLRAGLMARHVERGEGKQALELLPLVEAGPSEVGAEGRRVALLAMRQVEVPLGDELRLYRAQLRSAAPDGSRPSMEYRWDAYGDGSDAHGFERARYAPHGPSYRNLLDEAVARLDSRDPSHRTSLGLLLGEMERLPDAEALWMELAGRLEGWHLDDELGPRYERALQRFDGGTWWERAARWYARHKRQAELRKLAEDVAARFRGAALFERAQPQVALEMPENGAAGARVRLVPWADYVRLKALERFPHSPRVFAEALGRLLTREDLSAGRTVGLPLGTQPVIVDAALREERRAALLFADPARREEFLSGLMRDGKLEARLRDWEQSATRTPVEDRLLFDGWARLSQFERSAPAADRLAAAYPGDGGLAQDALSLHRSLASLSPAHATSARTVVERTAPALEDPNALWTGLGELEQERGRGDLARETWGKLLEREPRDPKKVEELATLLWDYGYMREALDVVEQGRKRLARPRLLAFEAGVLHEELKDVEGAVREYLGAAEPDERDCFCTWFEADQRALRRLSQLLARARVRALVLRVIDGLRPGLRADEQRLVALYPLAQIEMPDDTLDFTADDWIDRADLPNDPVGREQREATRADWRPQAREGFTQVGAALLKRTLALLPQGSEPAFLDAVAEWQSRLVDARWGTGQDVDLEDALRARRAELAPSDEDRVALEVARARFLFERGRPAAADKLWAALAPRVEALPQGAPRLHAEAERAAYLERARGVDAAAAEWNAITTRYPWSRGLLEARLAFLTRVGRGAEGRRLLEQVAPRAAAGHREALLTRLAQDALAAHDLPQARRAVELLAGQPGLDAAQRLGVVHLLARLRLRENAQSDLTALAKEQGPRFEPQQQADLYAQIAGAAEAEKQWQPALALWIEALNRRLDRPWIRSAWRAAERGGRTDVLTRFFETQQQRSPRDVRWAVAVRELRLLGHDLEGAIRSAQAAVDVRPERESLWSEAADLLVRAGRPRDAADYLAGWAKPRPADESVASWRSRLYAEAGAGERALEVEREALSAFGREAQGDERDERLGERQTRAVRRLMDYGLPREALQLATGGDVRKLDEISLDWQTSADLALRNDKLGTFLAAFGDQDAAREGTALMLSQRGRPEHKQEALAFVLKQLVPPLAAGKGLGPWEVRGAALRQWWSFAGQAEIEPALRAALARRALGSTSGPWSAEPPAALVEAVGAQIVGSDRNGRPVMRQVDVPALWVRHLVERDDSEALGAFLAPHVAELGAQVTGTSPVSGTCRPHPPRNWTRWLDDRAALETWVRWAASRPEGLAALVPAFQERKRWDRLWALGACGWNVTPLVAAVPEETRAAWFRMWLNPSPQDADPVLRARGETLDGVGRALARLVSGAPGAAGDALLTKLRGPRTVGDVLGQDATWTWPEFTPRPGTSDDRVTGRGADAGRFPGELWGERPGQAWYVLETLARWRGGDATAARVPLEVAERGRARERALLAARLADRLGDGALALELSADYPAGATDLERLRAQLRRVRDARGADDAQAALRAEVRRLQGSLSDASFRNLAWMAEDLGLAGPLDALDPSQPLSSLLLAYLYERYGAPTGARFHARDTAEFRVALASRWAAHERALDAGAVRVWLRDLWATGAAALPRRGLRTLGGAFPAAADWLQGLPQSERGDALDALDALPDTAPVEALLGRAADPRSDSVRLMRVRVKLMQNDEAGALALLDETLGELRGDTPLGFQKVALRESTGDDDEADDEPEMDDDTGSNLLRDRLESFDDSPTDAVALRLRAWLRPFEQAQRGAPAAERVRAQLRELREQSAVVPLAPSWRLELELTPAGPEREALLRELEYGWIRGDWSAWSVAPIASVVAAQAPAEAPRWIARLPHGAAFDSVALRAGLLTRVKDERGAAAELIAARRAELWTPSEDVRAFDQWRRLSVTAPAGVSMRGARSEFERRDQAGGSRPPGPGTQTKQIPDATSDPGSARPPSTWSAALAFWKRPPGEATAALAEHLRRHPFDILAARAALRTAAPADEEPLRLAERVLVEYDDDGRWSDQQLLQTRRARALLERSWRAAHAAFAQRDAAALAADLERRRMRAADVQATLADLARASTPAGDARTAEAALAALDLRRPAEAARLRAELRPQRPLPTLRPFELASDGAIRPLRPRTLDWPLLAAALAQEATP